MGAETRCRCCERGLPKELPRKCPECGHVFKGNGWDGIDAYWRSGHEGVMRYEEFWQGSYLGLGGLKNN